jgi:putative heme-binding domain-containing protein
LRKIGGEKVIHDLQPLAKNSEPLEIRQPAILTLAGLDIHRYASNAISLLTDLTNAAAALGAWKSLLANNGAGAVLAASLPSHGFPLTAGEAGLRAVRQSGESQPELVMALTRSAGLHGKETTLTAAEVKAMGQRALKDGDPARGELIFRRPQESCTSCHSIGGAGGKVGPDLTSIGASSPIDYLVESVLYPNKEIKEGFQSVSIATTEGEMLTGIPVHENASELTIRNAAGQIISIPKKEITSRKIGGSLMPSGLVDHLSQQEQLDLYKFLSELGRPGPFDGSKGNVARVWWVAADPNADTEKQLLVESPTGLSWRRVLTLVDGKVNTMALENAGKKGPVIAVTRFRSVGSGAVQFHAVLPAGASVWMDGKPMTGQNNIFSA